MLGKFLKFLQCVKTGVKRRKENKFYKFVWFRGEENTIFWVLQSVKLKNSE